MVRSPRADRLRSLPAVESLLHHPAIEELSTRFPHSVLVEAIRAEIADARSGIQRNSHPAPDTDTLARRAAARATEFLLPSLRRVLNATGVVLHTNLGRAPLPTVAREAIAEVAAGYSSLEYDL